MSHLFETFSSLGRSNINDETNSTDTGDWADSLNFNDQDPYYTHNNTAPSSHKRKRHHPQNLSISKPKQRKVVSTPHNISTSFPNYFEPYGYDSPHLTPYGANVLFPDPDQYSSMVPVFNGDMNDTIFSPMPQHTTPLVDWEHCGYTPKTTPTVTTPFQSKQTVTIPSPSPSTKNALTTTEDSSPRKTNPCIKSQNPEDEFSEYQVSDPTSPDSVIGKKSSIKKEIKKLDHSTEYYEDDDSFLEDNEPPKKRRRKNKKQDQKGGYNRGAWTEEEHQLFLEGLEKYGRSKWREIAEHVGTRSRIQVASHSQKYFAKLEQAKGSTKMRTKKTKGKRGKKSKI